MIQIVSLAAALLLLASDPGARSALPEGSSARLAAYAANQTGRVSASSLGYSLANLVAAGTLAVVALLERQWGFLLFEGAWCGVSAAALLRLRRVR